MRQLIKGPTIHTGTESLVDGAVLIENNQIIDVLSTSETLPNNVTIKNFPKNYHLLPGMIDMHIHGSNGADVMDATTTALQTIADSLLTQGTAAFLATTMTATITDTEKALINIKNFVKQQTKGARVLGIHLEGPFIAKQYHAAQRKDLIIPPDLELLKHWQTLSGDLIKLVTIAPEIPGALEVITYCKQNNILTSLGHSDADYTQALAGINAGINHATHLFNAMRNLHHRQPGAITALLLNEHVYTELIADGNHLHDAIMHLTFKLKGANKILLITDACRAQCLNEGVYELGGQKITVKDKAVRLENGNLAGSILTLPVAIQHILRATPCTINDVVKMISTNPAKHLNLKNYGKIAAGYLANFIILDNNLNIINQKT